MGKRISKKQRGFVKDYIETGNATEAAARNYNVKNRDVARAVGTENLAKPTIQNLIQEALPDELLAKVHLEGLKATCKSKPDYSVRHKYLDSAYKVKGSYAPEKRKIEVEEGLNLTPEDQEIVNLLKERARNSRTKNMETEGSTPSTLDTETSD